MASKVLVLNSGSSSLKFKLFDSGLNSSLTAVVGGLVERIGDLTNSRLKAGIIADKKGDISKVQPIQNHESALEVVMRYLQDTYSSGIKSEVQAIGHRVVHGEDISEPVLIDDSIEAIIKSAATLAPLHNPANLQGIRAAASLFPGCPQVAVFDTAFHQTMAPRAYMYALPYHLYTEHKVRKYGFHGSSYSYLVGEASRMLNKPVDSLNLIVCHLGAGSSICAVEKGKCIDTTMGMTPLEGLVMATRCGDMDPAIVLHLVEHCGVTLQDIDQLLNKKSGLSGLTGKADLRAILEDAAAGSDQAKLAIEVFIHRIRRYIGAYLVHLRGNVDAIVFSAGIGENSAIVRYLAMEGLENFGIHIDDAKNKATTLGLAGEIQSGSSEKKVLVIPTDEELGIAQQTIKVVSQQVA